MRIGGPCFLFLPFAHVEHSRTGGKASVFFRQGNPSFFLRRLVLVLRADVSLTGKGSGGGSSVMVSL